MRAVIIIVGGAAFVALGICGLLLWDMPPLMAWSCIGFFSLCFPAGIFHLRDRRPQIIINELGIFDRLASKEAIPWGVIKDAYIISVHGQKFICLVVDDRYEPSKSWGGVYRQMVFLNKVLGAQKFNITLGQIKIRPQRLLELILYLRAATDAERTHLLKKALTEGKRMWR